MTSHRVRTTLILVLVHGAVSCKGESRPGRGDSVVALSPAVAPPVTPMANTGWDSAEAGPLMLIAVPEKVTQASIILPLLTDSTLSSAASFRLESLSGLPVDLFNRAGPDGTATLGSETRPVTPEGCLSWPLGVLGEATGTGQWRAGFRKGLVKSLPLDSLEGANPADSLVTTTELARLASALAGTNDPVFQGLPFAVRKAYWFNIGTTKVLIGDIVRKINEEANPREEHLLLIAERPPDSPDGYVTAFHSRVAGAEDIVRTSEILSAIRFVKDNKPAMVVSFEYADGNRIALVERVSAGSWKIRWQSAYAGC